MAIPVVAALLALVRSRRRCSFAPLRGFGLTGLIGTAVGLVLSVLYSMGLHGRIPAGQLIATCYWSFSIACLLVVFNRFLTIGIQRSMGLVLRDRANRPTAEVSGALVRATLLLAVGVPYVLSMVLVFRPRIVRPGTPASLLNAAYQTISFDATDGTRLKGWWIPATKTDRTDQQHPAQSWGTRTIILCHGFGADKAADLRLVRDLVPNGYNVFALDFRAHGQSDGQLTTFGALERHDVLGAVRWVKANHPQESERVFGLGESMGAAALINAAADQSAEGQSIEAIAVFAPYDRLNQLLKGVADVHYAPAAGWLAANVGLPIAGAHLGINILKFSPSVSVQSLWPRPLLVLASDEDRGIDSRRGHALFDNALQPKFHYWTSKGSRETILFNDDDASLTVRIFFETSQSIL
ncbi:MAG TPA: alpha/beta fold hydrolase [Humisphaera sp.]|nr:alpha/beta fold hydrolase [Humisphaera sp.]